MSKTAESVPVYARLPIEHAEQLRHLADDNASTISRQIARAVANHLSAQQHNNTEINAS